MTATDIILLVGMAVIVALAWAWAGQAIKRR